MPGPLVAFDRLIERLRRLVRVAERVVVLGDRAIEIDGSGEKTFRRSVVVQIAVDPAHQPTGLGLRRMLGEQALAGSARLIQAAGVVMSTRREQRAVVRGLHAERAEHPFEERNQAVYSSRFDVTARRATSSTVHASITSDG